MNEWQCLLCAANFDGVLHTKPDNCPECHAPERYIVSAHERAEVEEQNRAINKHDEFLKEDKNG